MIVSFFFQHKDKVRLIIFTVHCKLTAIAKSHMQTFILSLYHIT